MTFKNIFKKRCVVVMVNSFVHSPLHGPFLNTISSIAMSLLTEDPLMASNIIYKKKIGTHYFISRTKK